MEKKKLSIGTVIILLVVVAAIAVGATYMFMKSDTEKEITNTSVKESNVENTNTNVRENNAENTETVKEQKKIDISDKKLGYFLGCVSFFNYPEDEGKGNVKKSDDFYKGLKLDIASDYIKIANVESDNINYKKDEIDTAIKELFGEDKSDIIESKFSLLKYNKNKDAYEYKEASDENHSAYFIKIENQEYVKDDEYKITYTYAYIPDSEIIDNNLEGFDYYRTTVNVKVNDNYKYSKYQLTNATSMKSVNAGKAKDVINVSENDE